MDIMSDKFYIYSLYNATINSNFNVEWFYKW